MADTTDAYNVWGDGDDGFVRRRKKTTWERAQEIFDELDSDPELMADFQLQLRRRKLKQLKK